MIEFYGDTLIHGRLILTATPVTSSDAVSLATVQNLISASRTLAPCSVALLSNTTLSGLLTIQGVALASGSRVLAAAQTNPVDNGIYAADTGIWSRVSDFATGIDGSNTIVSISSGDSANFIFKSQSTAFTVGTGACFFTYLTGTGSSSVFASRSINSSGIVNVNDTYILVNCSAGNITLSLPLSTSASTLSTVKVFRIIKTDNTINTLTISTISGETFLDGRVNITTDTPGRQFDVTALATIQKYSIY